LVRLIAVEMAFKKTPAIPRYRGTKNLTISLISTTSQVGFKDHVQIYMILVVMYHDTNENSKDPPFKGRDFAIHIISFVVS
jgi:hypothetical protein